MQPVSRIGKIADRCQQSFLNPKNQLLASLEKRKVESFCSGFRSGWTRLDVELHFKPTSSIMPANGALMLAVDFCNVVRLLSAECQSQNMRGPWRNCTGANQAGRKAIA